ncbi:hypothetical protein GDO86_005462 [Hymenochirus boettgeri]|uniref:Uncharacterized protein n=1 Tax=Hymenochirus boettgeri TaxID=247094 RepID=A0A8T2J1Y9_9PIPI|nr:hypothetical protein GDO86_005462 [Hymenochirus boettgeri]
MLKVHYVSKSSNKGLKSSLNPCISFVNLIFLFGTTGIHHQSLTAFCMYCFTPKQYTGNRVCNSHNSVLIHIHSSMHDTCVCLYCVCFY